MREIKNRWFVTGQYGGYFTNIKEAKEAAKFQSANDDDRLSDFYQEATIIELASEAGLYKYERGKCVYDWKKD